MALGYVPGVDACVCNVGHGDVWCGDMVLLRRVLAVCRLCVYAYGCMNYGGVFLWWHGAAVISCEWSRVSERVSEKPPAGRSCACGCVHMTIWCLMMMWMLIVSASDKLMYVSDRNARERACVSVIVATRNTNGVGER
jgi:hypothetical protein